MSNETIKIPSLDLEGVREALTPEAWAAKYPEAAARNNAWLDAIEKTKPIETRNFPVASLEVGDEVVHNGEVKVIRFFTGDPIGDRRDLHFGPLDYLSVYGKDATVPVPIEPN